jgi:hypothetical protein
LSKEKTMTERRKREDRAWTEEEQKILEPILVRTWQYIASDAEEGLPKGRGRVAGIVELCIDADRPVTCGGATREQHELLTKHWRHPTNQGWLRKTLNY